MRLSVRYGWEALLSTTPGRGGHEMQVADAERVAGELRLALNTYRVTSLPQLQPALQRMAADRIIRICIASARLRDLSLAFT